MTTSPSRNLGFGITCIDADYISSGTACFYLLEHSGECAVIETGTSRSLVNLECLLRERHLAAEQVRYVMPTHVHLDHAGGAGAMMARFPQATLLVHPRGAQHLENPQRLVASSQSVYGERRFRELYGEVVPVDAARMVSVADGEVVMLGGRALEIRHTRGHANHHYCVWDGASSGWFCGDMFGISYPWFRCPGGDFLMPTTTPTQFDPGAFLQSLALLESYRPARFYLTHFGELAYSSAGYDSLVRQLREYQRLAELHAGDREVLAEAIVDYSLGLMRELGAAGSDQSLRQDLAFDAGLNAQGLSVWMAQRERGARRQ